MFTTNRRVTQIALGLALAAPHGRDLCPPSTRARIASPFAGQDSPHADVARRPLPRHERRDGQRPSHQPRRDRRQEGVDLATPQRNRLGRPITRHKRRSGGRAFQQLPMTSGQDIKNGAWAIQP